MPSLIRERRSGVFFIVSSENGKRVWRSTRTRNRKEAYQTFLLTTNETSKTESRTLAKCIEEYMRFAKTNFAKKTQGIYELTLKHLLNKVGDIEIEKINTIAIEQYKSDRARKVKPATVNIELRTMRAFFNCMKKWEIVAKNPCDGVKQIRIPDEIPSYLTREQMNNLLKSITDLWLREIVIFASMTGMRLGEITNLSWDNVNLASRVITICSNRDYQVKGGRTRIIPINQTVLDLLKSKEPKQGLVFRGIRGGRANANFVSEKFRETVRKMNFDRKLHFHSLRHTFASLLVTNGTSLYHVQKLLGHSSSRVTEIYAHLQSSSLQKVVESISV